MNDKIVPKSEKFDSVKKFITSKKSMEAITMALPRHITPDKMARVAITSIVRTPELLECDPVSIMDAVLQASTLGLLPDGVLGHGYILPYKDRKTGRKIATFIPGYKGLLYLARNSESISWVQARIVYENDQFEYSYGMGNNLFHVDARQEGKEPGAFRCVYAIAKFKDREFQFEIMYRDQVELIQKKARGGNVGAWVSDWESMALKTVIRRLCKFLPLNPEAQRAVARDEYAEAGVLDEYIDVPVENVDEQGVMDPLDALTHDLEEQKGQPPLETQSESPEPPDTGLETSSGTEPEPPDVEAEAVEEEKEEAPHEGGDDLGPQPHTKKELPFEQQDSGRITRSEDANFVAAVMSMKEKLLKHMDEDEVGRFVSNRCGVYGAEKPIEIRARLDREKLYRDLKGKLEECEAGRSF